MYNTMYLVATIKYNYNFHNYNIKPTELGRPDLYRPRDLQSCIMHTAEASIMSHSTEVQFKVHLLDYII